MDAPPRLAFTDRHGKTWTLDAEVHRDPVGGIPRGLVAGLFVTSDEGKWPLALVLLPRCRSCKDGLTERACGACDGEGRTVQYTYGVRDETDDCVLCRGAGRATCSVCGGDGLLARAASAPAETASTCRHDLAPAEDYYHAFKARRWTFLRCRRCGLGALARGGSRELACAKCGFVGCLEKECPASGN